MDHVIGDLKLAMEGDFLLIMERVNREKVWAAYVLMISERLVVDLCILAIHKATHIIHQ